MKHATPARLLAVRWGWIAAIAASFALVQACGGRATGVVDGEDEGPDESDEGTGATSATPLLPLRSGGSASTDTRAPAATPPARAGEVCYSPSRLSDVPEIEAILPLLNDAIDGNGCIVSKYSNWIDGGGCNYDPRPAVRRGERCCYLLNGTLPNCG